MTSDAWVLLRDGFVIDGIFDDEESANIEAANNRRNYLGTWTVKYVKNLKKFLGQAMKPLEDIELGRAVRELTR